MKRSLIVSILVFHVFIADAQKELYQPLEIQKAYKNKTRSLDGQPGELYWQNFSKYAIEANIEPGSWKIEGFETVDYTNNSPDSLLAIIIKTYPNHYKKGGARANTIPLEDISDGLILENLKINNEDVNLNEASSVVTYSTFIKIMLSTPIAPKESVRISMNWTTEIPPIYVNRIGAYDKESAFLGYWYPQIGVYDDIDGWDENEYLGSQEFYRDFADFDVKITLPGGFKTWGTGTLQNSQQVLTRDEYQRYQESHLTEEVKVIYQGGASETSDQTPKTWIFKANNVQDFAAGISNNFRWEASTVRIQNRSVSSNVVYDPKFKDPDNVLVRSQNDGIRFLSDVIPGIAYPYAHFTTFVGVPEFDGMEFPMLANNGFGSNEEENVEVTFHELAHTYFPFYVGINEVKYSWMEEGWAAFLTIKFIQEYYKGTANENAELYRVLHQYNRYAGHQWESPLIAPTNHLVYRPAHVQLSYKKPAFLYLTLQNMLGDALFSECLRAYVQRWAGKHPTPYDFMFTFNDVSKLDLNWFWQAWIFDYGYADLAIKEIRESKVWIENTGRLPMPVFLKLVYKNGQEKIIHKTADIWAKGDRMVSIELDDFKNLESLTLLSDRFPDVDIENNSLNIDDDK